MIGEIHIYANEGDPPWGWYKRGKLIDCNEKNDINHHDLKCHIFRHPWCSKSESVCYKV